MIAKKNDFNFAVELLHSFEYDEAEKAFAKVIDESPMCAMAYWGVAMSNFHPLWSPPSEAELQKGAHAISIAKGITEKSERESGYINAIGQFYSNWNTVNHHARCVLFEKAMEQLYARYPEDTETAIFYALALDAAADPQDKTYAHQKKAGVILNGLYAKQPNHPGIIHYIIHTYDYPALAYLALPAARKYASVAPSSAHALHMPSHIFTRLGLWNEAIASNQKSVDAATCYASSAHLNGHWDEELHGLDYLVYAYLQKGDNKHAADLVKYVDTLEVNPKNFKVAYAFAAIPCRYVMENKMWKEAASLEVKPANFSWPAFPWQAGIIHFTRLMGAVHTKNAEAAKLELIKLNLLRDTLLKQKDAYKAKEIEIQIKSGEAWMKFESSNKTDALRDMMFAADMEDSTEKHPVTPGEVLPARELLGDMFLQSKQYNEALRAYEAVLDRSPDRFNSLYGAAVAAEKSGDKSKAAFYFKELLNVENAKNSDRAEIVTSKTFLSKL